MKPICSYEGCEKVVYARGFCLSHYGKFMRNGTPEGSAVFKHKVCSLDDCECKATRKGLCDKHYKRKKKHGDPNAKVRKMAAAGEPYKFLCEEIKKETDECMIWPYAKLPNGYGVVRVDGILLLAHRVACEIVHGKPFEDAKSAHLCGNGHLACFNPKHLKWSTNSENEMHKVAHGTSNRGSAHGLSVRNEGDILELKRLIDSGLTDTQISKTTEYDSRYVNMIRHGKVWGWLTGFGKGKDK